MSEGVAKSPCARFVDGMSHAAATTDGAAPRCPRPASATAPSQDSPSPEFSSEYPPMQGGRQSGIIPKFRN